MPTGRVKKGEVRNPLGRTPGTKNKVTRDIRQLILDTLAILEKEGKGLAKVSKDKPEWFYEHFVKPMIPKDMKIDADVRHGFDGSDTERATRLIALLQRAEDREREALKKT